MTVIMYISILLTRILLLFYMEVMMRLKMASSFFIDLLKEKYVNTLHY